MYLKSHWLSCISLLNWGHEYELQLSGHMRIVQGEDLCTGRGPDLGTGSGVELVWSRDKEEERRTMMKRALRKEGQGGVYGNRGVVGGYIT